jgi:hypothetical protein
MSRRVRWIALSAALAGAGLPALPSTAAETSDESNAQLLEAVREQSRQLEDQRRRLDDQERRLREQEAQLLRQQQRLDEEPAQAEAPGAAAAPDPALEQRSAKGPGTDMSAPPPDVLDLDPFLVRRGGVLLTPGVVAFDPQLEWSTSSMNRFFFQGIQVADAVLLGEIEASDMQREAAMSSLGVRIGWTEYLELEAQVPVIRRSDELTTRIVSTQDDQIVRRKRDGTGLGDIAFALHYQLNEARDDSLISIANLRVTAPTGRSPFKVRRDELGFERELATGSGSWSIEPSVTVIMPTDPAVVYGNINYAFDLSTDADESINTGSGMVRLGRVDPGDSVGLSLGMALALNEQTSLHFGYSHDYELATRTEIDGHTLRSDPFHIGMLEIGVNHRSRRGMNLDLTLGFGVTEEAPDVRVNVRSPMTIEAF